MYRGWVADGGGGGGGGGGGTVGWIMARVNDNAACTL